MAIMERMGFDHRWCSLIFSCLSSVNFAILVNGQQGRKFAPLCGLRQGDPLSPYFFLFVSEVLSLLISKAYEDKLISRIRINPHRPVISHIFFVDDKLFFLKADVVNCTNLVQLINQYCAASEIFKNLVFSLVLTSQRPWWRILVEFYVCQLWMTQGRILQYRLCVEGLRGKV